jgi:hypothetical protein
MIRRFKMVSRKKNSKIRKVPICLSLIFGPSCKENCMWQMIKKSGVLYGKPERNL